MTVKDILKLVCSFVGERDILSKFEVEDSTFTAREEQKVESMVRCFNLVLQEIASDYIPFLIKEEIDVENSILNFSNLNKSVVNVYEIKNRFGMNLKFKLFPNYVEIEGKAKSIVYSFLPDEKGLNDEAELCCGITPRVLAYGIASEYFLIEGIGEDAEIWEERFKESLFILSRKRGEHILPKRNWI